MEYLGQYVGGHGGSQGQARPGWGSFEDDLYRIISFPADSSEKCCLTLQGFDVCSNSTRNKLKTYHDVIPISCLTEFPNVVQMAKVSRDQLNVQQFNMSSLDVSFFSAKLVCEDVNVDRFFPVLYPKVRPSLVCM